MSDHPTHSMARTVVADALAATPGVTNVTYTRDDGHQHVQIRCQIAGDTTDVTVLASKPKAPYRAVQAASNAAKRDASHCFVAPDTRTGIRISRLVGAPIAERTGNGIQLLSGNQVFEDDGAVVVTAPGTEPPAWWVRGTDATADRDRVCELKYEGRVLATYNLEHGAITLEEDCWTEVEVGGDGETRQAIAPLSDHHSSPQSTEWHRVKLPLCVPSTIALTRGAVYVLPDVPGNGVAAVNALPRESGYDDLPEQKRVDEIVNRTLSDRTVESPSATIPYDEFNAVLTSQLQAEDRPVPSAVSLNQSLTNAASVTIQRTIDGRQLRGRAWAVPQIDSPNSDSQQSETFGNL